MLKKNPFLNLFSYLWKYSAGKRHWVVLYIFLSAIANAVLLTQPIIIGKILDAIQFNSDNQLLLPLITRYFSLLILITFVFWIFHGTSRVMETQNAFLVRKNYKNDMFKKVLELPIEWHQNHHSGDTIDKIDKASKKLFEFSEEVFMHVQSLIILGGSIIILTFYYKEAGITVVFVTLLIIILVIKLDKILTREYRVIFRKENYLASGIHDYISNIITVITLRIKKRATREVKRLSMQAFPVFKSNTAKNQFKWFSIGMTISIMTVLILISNAYSQIQTTGIIVIGTLFALYRYLDRVGGAFFNFTWQYGELVERNTAVIAAGVINKAYEERSIKQSQVLPLNWKELAVKNLTFVYKGTGAVLLKRLHIDNISFKIWRGKKIAFVGESGSGKSTVLTLLRGLYETDRVKVFCDGNKLKRGLEHFREYTTLIPQDPEIFQNTLRRNITMGTQVNKLELDSVIRLARLAKVIKRLKKGLETNVMERGVSLSGGEKQRVALARGLLAGKISSILLLDEPTSSVDTSNELKIYQAIFKEYRKKTILASVHRLHLLKYFDFIYYFKDGKIVAEGTLEKILENEEFNKLWNNYHHQ